MLYKGCYGLRHGGLSPECHGHKGLNLLVFYKSDRHGSAPGVNPHMQVGGTRKPGVPGPGNEITGPDRAAGVDSGTGRLKVLIFGNRSVSVADPDKVRLKLK